MKEIGFIQGPASEGVRNALIALAVRCETEEPSRELDAAIENMLAGGSAADLAYILEDVERTTKPPRFTTSLDAAVSLVPEGASWSLTVQGACEAEVTLPTGRFLVDGDIERFGRSGVPAKALCAAALRARAEIGK